ncbi:MAG: hypothetical protein LBT56_07790 [Prevotellaceae bacterium]|jgi:endonuclease III|nr:hypothetical protein [Prevotellaceae bacterium]
MEKIVELGLERFKEQNRQKVHFVNDKTANNLLNDIDNNPHVYVLACLMDRQIKAEKAWIIPQKIFDIFTTNEIDKLSEIDKNNFVEEFENNKLHRFNKDMAEIFYAAIQHIKNKYNYDASKIWKDKPSSALVIYRFLEFKGCGIKIATMAANILARQYKIEFSDYYSIDISPDTHIMRVMKRMGYVSNDSNREMVIYKARELYPKFPGIIDSSCWEIGRQFCKPKNPDCDNCIIKEQCKKII